MASLENNYYIHTYVCVRVRVCACVYEIYILCIHFVYLMRTTFGFWNDQFILMVITFLLSHWPAVIDTYIVCVYSAVFIPCCQSTCFWWHLY